MKNTVRARLAAGVFIASTLHASGQAARLTVLLYNYSTVHSHTLVRAENEVARIYARSGISFVWLECARSPAEAADYPACNVPPGPDTPIVRLLPSVLAQKLGRVQDSLGFAMFPEDGGFATTLNVFSDEAEEMAMRERIPSGVLLGHVMAHELAHILLGVASHSETGIMRARWREYDLEMIRRGTMEFNPRQEDAMQEQVERRHAYGRAGGAPIVRPISKPLLSSPSPAPEH